MDKSEAVGKLGVTPDAAPDQIRRRFQELYADFRIRLTNAPTPELRKTYQKQLRELRAACEALVPGIDIDGDDLPAAEPVAARRSPPSTGSTRAAQAQPGNKNAGNPRAGLTRSTIWLSVLAIALASFASFLAIKWSQQRTAEVATDQTGSATRGNGEEVVLGTTVPGEVVLLLRGSSEGRVRIDGIDAGERTVGESQRVRIGRGEHIVEVIDPDDNTVTVSRNVVVTGDEGQKIVDLREPVESHAIAGGAPGAESVVTVETTPIPIDFAQALEGLRLQKSGSTTSN